MQSATLDSVGFFRDYRELSELKALIDNTLDHRHLNEVLGHDRTTSEVIAKWIYDWCSERWAEVAAAHQRDPENVGGVPSMKGSIRISETGQRSREKVR